MESELELTPITSEDIILIQDIFIDDPDIDVDDIPKYDDLRRIFFNSFK